MSIEETLKQIAEELKFIRAALETIGAPKKDLPEVEDPELTKLKEDLTARGVRFAKRAAVEDLQAKLDADNKKNERVTAAQAKKAEKAAAPAPAAPKPEVKPTIKQDDLKAAVIDFAKKNGKAAAINVLKSFDAAKVSEVAVVDYEKFMLKLRG